MKSKILVWLALTAFACPSSYAGIADFLGKVGISKKTSFNDTRMADGLKEALKIGIDKAVEMTGKTDGYLKNNNIKIGLPDRVKKFEPILKRAGFGPKMDELVLSMNRAAEKAAPQARDIFIEVIASMTFEDVEKIRKGGDTAATEYLKSKTSGKLGEIYRPVIAGTMKDYGVVQQYHAVNDKYKSLPLANSIKLPEVEDYVVQKSLDGLFFVLGEQEKKIRTDPAAQVTQLLKEVFSSAKS